MRYLILSDIHDNYEAFQTVIQKKAELAPDVIVYLGDIIGYGASPRECLDLARRNEGIYILGNHEHALIRAECQSNLGHNASWAIDWTRTRLDDRHLEFIKTFELIHSDFDITFVHASPREPDEFDYICDFQEADRAFRHLKTRLCFVGHTHVPSLFIEGDMANHPLLPGTISLDKKKRYIINGGSVGQPRDRDKRLACVVFDSDSFELTHYRYDYDKERSAQKIREAGLPDALAERLL
jgi:predicted phosphodiesterase